MEDYSADELLYSVKEELIRVYGKRYTDLCFFDASQGSWYYFSEPIQGRHGRLRVKTLAKPIKKKETLSVLETLRAKKSKKIRWFGLR